MTILKCFTMASVIAILPLQSVLASNFYGGAGLGLYKNDLSSSDFDQAFATNGISSDTSVDDNATAWKVFGGYRFNQYVAVELGYQDFGDFDAKTRVLSPISGTVKTNTDVDAFNLSVNLGTSITDELAVFAKLGYMDWNADIKSKASINGVNSSTHNSDNGSDFIWGLGFSYKINDSFDLRGDWDRLSLGSDINIDYDAYSMSIQFNF